MERFELALPIFKLISTYQLQLEKIQQGLLSFTPRSSLNLFLQQIFYEASKEKNYLTTGDLFRFVKGKKIFFNASNLIQFFSFYDLDNDYHLSLKEFANIFAFDIEPNKYVSKADLNTEVVYMFVNLLMKELELCEKLRSALSEFYSTNKTFNSNELFDLIKGSDEKNSFEFADLERFISLGGMNKEQMKRIYMKLSSNSLEAITRKQFQKFFRTLSLSNNNNDLLLENDTSMMMNTSQLSEMLNQAVSQTRFNNSEISQQKKKFEYEMFYSFIKCLIAADNSLSHTMTSDHFFNSGTLFNSIKKSSLFITKEDLFNQLATVYGLSLGSDDVDLLFEKYSSANGHTMSFDLFNKMLKISISQGSEDKKPNESVTLFSFPPETNKKIGEMFKTLMKNEKKIEDFRRKLNKMSHFNLREMFNNMTKGECFATSFDLIEYFSISNQDADLLMRRFDKDNDGKISYDDVRSC